MATQHKCPNFQVGIPPRCPDPTHPAGTPSTRDPLTRVNGDRPHDHVAIANHAAAVVVETVERCYRIQDSHRGTPDAWDAFTAGRHAGYCQTLALLLGTTTAEVGRLVRDRAL